MSAIDLPELDDVPVSLSIEERAVKGRGRTAPALEGRLTVGVPVATPLVDVALDDVQRAYIASQYGFDFYAVHLGCSMLAGGDERIDSAWFEVHLSRADGSSDDNQPIAWSLAPSRLVDKSPYERTIRIGAELKILDAVAATPAIETTTSGERTHVWLRSVGELESDPAWEFRSGPSIELDGSHRLVAIVRVPERVIASARVEVVANVRRKLLKLVPYRADLPPRVRTFEFGGRS